MKKINIFGYPVHLAKKQEALEYVLSLIKNSQGGHVVTINPEIIAAADKNAKLANIIKNAELILPESSGIMLAIRSLGVFDAEKIPGIEFCEALLKKCPENGYNLGFLGGKPGVLEKIDFPGVNIVFSHHGYFEDEEYILEQLKQSRPQLVLMGLGSPKQEFFINKAKEVLPNAVMIGVGGSFDVWTKKVKRAPVLFRFFGLEWFYRLVAQPERFNRMFPVLPHFFLRVVFDRKNLGKKYENERDK